MKLGVIGAGEMGGTLVRQYSKAGHIVKVGMEKIKALALETGALAVPLENIMVDVDAVVLAIPLISIAKLQQLFKNMAYHIPIIDTNNYYPIRDGIIDELENGIPEGIWNVMLLKLTIVLSNA